MSDQGNSKALEIAEITGPGSRGVMRMAVTPNPLYNTVNISFFWTPQNGNKVYVSDFADVKFREQDVYLARPDGKTVDAVSISADHLKVPTDQMIYAAGLNGLCEMSHLERQAYKDHIKDLQDQNAKLITMIAKVIHEQ